MARTGSGRPGPAARPGPARPPVAARRWPLARATAKSTLCLVLAFASLRALFYPYASGPHPSGSWAMLLYVLALAFIITAFGILAFGAATAVEQRQARRKPPPQPRLPARG